MPDAQKIRGRKRPAPAFNQPPAAGGMFPPGPPFAGGNSADGRAGPLVGIAENRGSLRSRQKSADPGGQNSPAIRRAAGSQTGQRAGNAGSGRVPTLGSASGKHWIGQR